MLLKRLLSESGNPAGPALVFDKSFATRRELADIVRDAALRLAHAGVRPGTKVLVALPNSPAFLVSLLAVNASGGVFVPLNPHLTPDERAKIDDIARPDFVIGERGQIELLEGACLHRTGCAPHEDHDLSSVAAIIFTSGTTGTPKGVMMSEDALIANARSVAAYLDLGEADRTLIFLPLYYTYTLSQIFSTWLAGGSIVLLRNLLYPVQALSAVRDEGITGFGGVPTSLSILATYAARSNHSTSLRYILSAGAPLAPALADNVQRAFPHACVFNNYGCTEIGPRATAVNFTTNPHKTGSIGQAIAGVSVTIVRSDLSVADLEEAGEIVLSGPSLMKGYYRNEQATRARISKHGFHTGDYGYADSDGYLYFEGRLDDIFKSGGEKVSVREIEDLLLTHEEVAEAAVVAVPDATLGAVPVAYVVLRPGSSCSERDLRTFCGGRLSRHKVPHLIHVVEEFHKTATGKVQKHRLREACL
jgi:acyl-CoA synthetase (AMP-forming)/AMP-acid ligase II